MQPYLFPYIGYFQLMAAVDKFVVFDDVSYINRGWINRNRLLLNGIPHTFTIPLKGASQNRLIYEIEIINDTSWQSKLMRTIRQAYGGSPCFAAVSELLESIIYFQSNKLDEFLLNSLRQLVNFLSLDVTIVNTSRIYRNSELKGQERILDICRKEQAATYINPIGGIDLYDKKKFSDKNIELFFLSSRPINYSQGKGDFVPWLSIIDVLMFNDVDLIRQLLSERDLI